MGKIPSAVGWFAHDIHTTKNCAATPGVKAVQYIPPPGSILVPQTPVGSSNRAEPSQIEPLAFTTKNTRPTCCGVWSHKGGRTVTLLIDEKTTQFYGHLCNEPRPKPIHHVYYSVGIILKYTVIALELYTSIVLPPGEHLCALISFTTGLRQKLADRPRRIFMLVCPCAGCSNCPCQALVIAMLLGGSNPSVNRRQHSFVCARSLELSTEVVVVSAGFISGSNPKFNRQKKNARSRIQKTRFYTQRFAHERRQPRYYAQESMSVRVTISRSFPRIWCLRSRLTPCSFH